MEDDACLIAVRRASGGVSSGGASGENALVVEVWSTGGRSAVGNKIAAKTIATAT